MISAWISSSMGQLNCDRYDTTEYITVLHKLHRQWWIISQTLTSQTQLITKMLRGISSNTGGYFHGLVQDCSNSNALVMDYCSLH